jgi:iron complex transport system substrate-binding protein
MSRISVIRTARCLAAAILFAGLSPAGAAGGDTDMQVAGADTVVDQAGRRLNAERPFTRIISLYGAHTENLFELGLGKQIIGVGRSEAYPPAARSIPVFSYRDDAEKFLAARPDLVLVRPMIDRGYPDLMARLEKSGIAVASLQPATVDEMIVYWKILGILTGRRDRAADMTARWQAAVARFRSLTQGVDPRRRVYFESIHSKMKTFTPQSMAIFALETAGGINAAGDAQQVRSTNIAAYGKERILARGPEIDVYLAQFGAMNQPSVTEIKSEPGFSVIRAIQNGKVCLIDEMIVSRPTLRLLAGVYEIGRILYPEQFDDRALEILKRAGVEPPGE